MIKGSSEIQVKREQIYWGFHTAGKKDDKNFT